MDVALIVLIVQGFVLEFLIAEHKLIVIALCLDIQFFEIIVL